MTVQRSFLSRFRPRDAGFVLTCLLCLVLLIPAQLASMIVFDSTGLDTLAPGFVFMAIVPAFILTLFPTLVAWRLYTLGATRATAAGAFAVFAIVATYTTQFYRLCGPGC